MPSCRIGGGSGPAPELHSCFADQPRLELTIRTPRHHGHAQPIGRLAKRPDADDGLCDGACVAHHEVLKSAGDMTCGECRDLSAENVQRVKRFVFAREKFVQVSNFRTSAESAGFENFRIWSVGLTQSLQARWR